MIDISVLVDKLNGFETADDVARFFSSQGVKGLPGQAQSCAISNWVRRESKIDVRTTCLSVKLPVTSMVFERFPLYGGASEFVTAFDRCRYPELIGPMGDEEQA